MYRTILFFLVLGAAAVTPFAISKFNSDEGFPLIDRLTQSKKPAVSNQQPSVDPLLSVKSNRLIQDPNIAELLKPPFPPKTAVVEPVVTPLPDVLRFDISPSYVTQRWPRVSTNLPDLEFNGMRVPVMTGTAPHDFHGSASYYFNRSHQLERIILNGYTDDPDGLMQFVTSTYRLTEYAANGQRLFLSYFKGQPLSMLRLRPSSISAQPSGSTEVILEINAPRDGAQLSQQSMSDLMSLRAANLL